MKEYISKLNDRNLQRKRESGITTYVLLSVLILIIFNLMSQYKLVPIEESFWEVSKILTYTFNIYLSIIIIVAVYVSTTGKLSSIRVISRPSYQESLLERLIDICTLILPLIINISVAIYTYLVYEKVNWYFLIISLILTTIFIFHIYNEYQSHKISNAYELYEGSGNPASDRDSTLIIVYIISFTMIMVSFYQLFNEPVDFDKIDSIIFGILIYSIPIVLVHIFELRKKNYFDKALEDLEYEINVRSLSDDEIRLRLQKKYLGFLLKEWIAHDLKELKEFKAEIEEKKKQLETLVLEKNSVDLQKYPIEYKGRENRINEFLQAEKLKIDKYFNDKLFEIVEIWSNSKLIEEERIELAKYYHTVKSEQSFSKME